MQDRGMSSEMQDDFLNPTKLDSSLERLTRLELVVALLLEKNERMRQQLSANDSEKPSRLRIEQEGNH
jgi:hypothetical protein